MSTVSNLTPTPASPLMPRTVGGRAYASYADEVYDPVLDPAVNAAIGDDVEQIEVRGRPEAEEKLSFWDLLDLVNPLQHIPGVNAIYRELTGDTIKPPMKLIGSTILGGPVGFAAAMADSIIEEATGRDVAGHAMTMFSDKPAAQTQLAQGHGAPVQLASADGREFIPGDHRVMPNTLAAQSVAAKPSATSRQAARAYAAAAPMPPAAAPTTPVQRAALPSAAPNETEAMVQTAQIAAQANVFPTFKRTGPTAAERTAANEKVVQTAQANGAGYKALDRTAERNLDSVVRHNGDVTPAGQLRAQTKYAPGSRLSGNQGMSPASLAAVNASHNKTRTTAPAPAASTQDAYAYGRQAVAGTGPQDIPVWFDSAMTQAIDKYNAMQQAK